MFFFLIMNVHWQNVEFILQKPDFTYLSIAGSFLLFIGSPAGLLSQVLKSVQSIFSENILYLIYLVQHR